MRFAIVVVLLAGACRPGGDASCRRDVAALSGSADEALRQRAVDSCGVACGKGDDASCAVMHEQVRELCARDRAWCAAKCNGDTFEQIKTAACAAAKP